MNIDFQKIAEENPEMNPEFLKDLLLAVNEKDQRKSEEYFFDNDL